jgi:uncharacterized protein YuzE
MSTERGHRGTTRAPPITFPYLAAGSARHSVFSENRRMRVKHDREVDAAYIQIVDVIQDGEAVRQVTTDSGRDGAEFTLDLDRFGRLLGVEVLGATRGLRPETLALAD